MKASQNMQDYFKSIQDQVNHCYGLATQARSLGFDPETTVNVKLAKNMAERVEGLMSTVAPSLAGTGFTKRIMALESEYSALDWRVALKIAEEVAKEKFCKFKDKKEAMEIGIRAGFTYHTGGIVSAPLEGFVELRIKKNKKGEDYLAPTYAGPIRGAGGTAAAFSLLITDYVRHVMGLGKYDPSEKEVNRYKSEINDYHERVTNLQYKPSDEEIEFLVKRLPIEIDGEPTEKLEVSSNKDLERVQTNRIRGGVCLVLAEGLSQKAPKMWKRLAVWGKDFGLEWGFLAEFLSLQKNIKAQKTKEKSVSKISPNFTFISDLVAGRPVLTHPMRAGGFRLRYGRSRISGFSCASINPTTMYFLNNFIATGTQLKMERPGKAASITPCDTIDGPIVKTNEGSVVKIRDMAHARTLKGQVKEILFLGDILFNFGDFSENGHILAPCGYNEEWWVKELEKSAVDMFGTLDAEKISHQSEIQTETVQRILSDPFRNIPGFDVSINLSKKLDIPLHPEYTYYWNPLDIEELERLFQILSAAKTYNDDAGKPDKIVIPATEDKILFEKIGVPHKFVNNEFIVIEKDHARSLLALKGKISGENALDAVNNMSKVTIRDKCGTFIGARMGRPEKAKMRKLTGSPHVLFPIGDEGGRLRSFQAALEQGVVNADFRVYYCSKCKKQTIYRKCETCHTKTALPRYCSQCEERTEIDYCHKTNKWGQEHGETRTFAKQPIDIKYYFDSAREIIGDRTHPDLIKGVRGTSNKDHIPEHIVKGILRAKHEVFVNKDGTIRFDMSELPMTHFTPAEVDTDIEKLIELGYAKDIKGRPLENPEQILELKPQDLVLPASSEALDEQSDKVLVKVASFIDELLIKLYKQKAYYNTKNKDGLIGHLVVGLAPHISAGTVGRIIGFSKTQGLFAHPLFHAAMRRDCDGDEACVIMLMDALLNFSRHYLPASRGAATMDAPLVLTSKLNPEEVDDMAHGLDIVWGYPLELYQGAMDMKNPWEVNIEQIKHTLGQETQYEGMGYTHSVSSINAGISCSAYKALPSMEEKLKGQMEIAERIRAVDENDVARLVIEKHLLRDTKGNLRKFSMQQFRCVKCNAKYRRPPLAGKCDCGGRIIFTVSHGSVIKYLEPTMSLAKKYNVPKYLKQTIDILSLRIDGVFGREREKQEGLGKWFG